MEESNVPNQIANATLKHFGNFCQRFQGDFSLGALDGANVISGQIHLFCQFLLTEASFLSFDSNCLSQEPINFSRR